MSAGQKRAEYRTRERSSAAFYSAPAGKRVDKGANYMITCKQRIVIPDWQEHLLKIIINNAPTGERAVVRIEEIV